MFLLVVSVPRTQIEISKIYGHNEWRDDVKRCLLEAGLQEKTVVFLFADTQVRARWPLSFLLDHFQAMLCPQLLSTQPKHPSTNTRTQITVSFC